jgi:hypothetical protein
MSDLTILLHCHNLPGTHFDDKTAVRLGIQNGNDVIEDVPGDAESVTFKVPLRVIKNLKTGKPNFLGRYTHGTPEERFLYLAWGERRGAIWQGFRRAKIHLNHLDWNTIDPAIKSGQPIEARLDMTDGKGGPLCASVRGDRIEWA